MSASAQLHLRPFVHLLAIGIPHDGQRERVTADEGNTTVRVLHSPSDPAKGSEAIRACLSSLEAAGLPIDYREISGRPHAEVLDAIGASDLVVDQLYSDSPLAVFATEAGYRGRAVVVGGYYANEIADDVTADLLPPSRFVPPEQLCGAIEALARDADARRSEGAKLAQFVQDRWAPADVARRFLRVAFADPPAEWRYDPARLRYVHGWGLSEAEIRDHVGQLVARCGNDALALDHHPALRDRLLALVAAADGATR